MGLYVGLLDVLGLPKCILLSKHIAMKHETLTHWFFTLLFLHELVVSKIEQGYASDVKDDILCSNVPWNVYFWGEYNMSELQIWLVHRNILH